MSNAGSFEKSGGLGNTPVEPNFERLSAFARGVTLALAKTLRAKKPVYLILDGDVAQTLGGILKEDWRIGSELLDTSSATIAIGHASA